MQKERSKRPAIIHEQSYFSIGFGVILRRELCRFHHVNTMKSTEMNDNNQRVEAVDQFVRKSNGLRVNFYKKIADGCEYTL